MYQEVVNRAVLNDSRLQHGKVYPFPNKSLEKPFARRGLKQLLGNIALCLLIAAIIDIAVINALFFPDCNRETRDCFMVQYLWGEK
jgi:hypothetical protein